MNLPADCILITGDNVTCNEAELNGEPDDKPKVPLPSAERFNANNQVALGMEGAMLAKSQCTGSFGTALIIGVGLNTCSGEAAKLSTEEGTGGTVLQ